LVRPLPFTFPVYRDSKDSLSKIRLGMWLYDLLALFRNVSRHHILGPEQVAALEPALDRPGLVGAARYFDCLADDARLTLATAQSAQRHGALVANYARVCGLVKEGGRVAGAEVVDEVSGERFTVRARAVINATGVWADQMRLVDEPGAEELIRVNRGCHVVLPRGKLGLHGAATFSSADGQRAMYVIPWGETCIVGTTDVDHAADLDRVYATAAEVEAILASTNGAFPEARLSQEDVISTFAGLRPLIGEEGKAAYQVSRDHHIFASGTGLVTIAGGKLTTYRRMAQDVVDFVSRRLEAGSGFHVGRSRSAQLPLAEGAYDLEKELAGLNERFPQFDGDVLAHLSLAYGPDAATVLSLAGQEPEMGRRIVPGRPYIWAEVPYAIQHEMALTLSDVLTRRTHIIHEDRDQGMGVAADVAALMARTLGWEGAEVERQVERYHEQVALTRAFEREGVTSDLTGLFRSGSSGDLSGL
jgi:glycerol-3-phosphate dehydrogenase